MVLSLPVGYWLTLLLAVPAAGFAIRIFIIQHDCSHGSFLKSKSGRFLSDGCSLRWRLAPAPPYALAIVTSLR